MSNPGGYPPAQWGQGDQSALIAAPSGEPLAEALATALRALGWRVVVTEQAGAYAREARVCVAPLTPASLNSAALIAALASPVAPLIPLTVGPASLPPGPWATPPIVFTGDPAQAARAIVAAANSLASAPSTYPSMQPPVMQPPVMQPPVMQPPATSATPMSGYSAPATGGYSGEYAGGYSGPATPSSFPPTGATIPYMPAAPAQPVQSYQSAPVYPTAYPTQAGYPQYPQGAPAYAQPPTPPKRRRWPLIVGVIVGVALLACVGASAYAIPRFAGAISASVSQTATAQVADSATATPAATATPTIPADFTVYTDSAGGYSIAYPQSWQKTASSGGVLLHDETDNADMFLIPVDTTVSQSDITSTESQLFQSEAGAGSFSNPQGPTPVTYAGVSWEQESADITTSGLSLHTVVLIANHGSHAYMIAYTAPTSSFAALDAQDFQPMLNSFSFQS